MITRLGVFISGSGTNLQALMDAAAHALIVRATALALAGQSGS